MVQIHDTSRIAKVHEQQQRRNLQQFLLVRLSSPRLHCMIVLSLAYLGNGEI
uniref:Uncharacterized protein n=1 Tax=Arundo donax TaxID=35708 RepID=A0A0A8ZU62_ARUDO